MDRDHFLKFAELPLPDENAKEIWGQATVIRYSLFQKLGQVS